MSDLLLGSGTEDDPFLIHTAEELDLIGWAVCDWGKHFRLMADLDMSGFDGREGRPSFNTIGTMDSPFGGVFDGNGYEISNLTIIGGSYVGLFGQLGQDWVCAGEVKNLSVVDANITGSGYCIGGLVGRMQRGSLTNCYSTGTVNGDSSVGGLVGANNGSIITSSSTCTVSGHSWVGGLVGWNQGTITDSHSTGAVGGDTNVGGLVGRSYSRISTSHNTSTVSGTGQTVGGLVGWNDGPITSSCSTGSVHGDQYVGGLVGSNYDGNITSSYSTGTVTGSEEVGGLVGYNGYGCHITSSYSTGVVSGDECVGGLVGRMQRDGTVSACLWDTSTSGELNMCGIAEAGVCDSDYGRPTAEMQTASTFLEAGWDFVDETENGTADIWWILEGQDYPRLYWELTSED